MAPSYPTPARSYWPLTGLFALSIDLHSLDRSLLAAVQPSILSTFHVDQAVYGHLVAAYSISYGISAPVMGYLIDRFGFRIVSATAVIVWSAAGTATGFATTTSGLLVCRVVLGAAEAAGLPAAGKAYATLLAPRDRTLGTALSQVALTIGTVAAVILAGLVSPMYSWRGGFWIAGPLGLIWAAVWLAKTSGLRDAAAVAGTSGKSGMGPLFKDRRLWALLAGNVLSMPLYTLWANWTTSYLVTTYAFTEVDANLRLAWAPPVFATAGALTGAFVSRLFHSNGSSIQVGRFRAAVLGSIGILSTALVPHAGNAGLATFIIGLSFFFTLWISVNVYAMSLDLFGEIHAGFVFSLLTCVYGIMAAGLSAQLGAWIEEYGFALVCYVGSVLPALGMLLLKASIFRKERRNSSIVLG